MKTRKFITKILICCFIIFLLKNFQIESLSDTASYSDINFISTVSCILIGSVAIVRVFYALFSGEYDKCFETHIEPKAAAIYKWFNRRNEIEDEPEETEEIEPSDKIKLPKTPPSPHPVGIDYDRALLYERYIKDLEKYFLTSVGEKDILNTEQQQKVILKNMTVDYNKILSEEQTRLNATNYL